MKAHITNTPTEGIHNGKVFCNSCKHEFNAHVKTEPLGAVGSFGEVERSYTECPSCHTTFNIGFVNEEVKDLLDANAQLLGVGTSLAKRNHKRNRKHGLRLMARIESEWRRQNEGKL